MHCSACGDIKTLMTSQEESAGTKIDWETSASLDDISSEDTPGAAAEDDDDCPA